MKKAGHSFCHPAALTIAGSDCSGGAGLEADLKTFAAHRVYGMAAVTCVVAETPQRVVSIHATPAKTVREQIACCLAGMPPVAVKTGMLFSREIINSCADEIARFQRHISHVVVDPVMVATSGKRLLKNDAIHALTKLIGEAADLATPNLDEAEILAGQRIRNRADMEKASRIMASRFSCAVLLKGGHLKNLRTALDYLWDGQRGLWLEAPRIRDIATHGTGCTYSSAIAANLALGHPLPQAVRCAKTFITRAIRKSLHFGTWSALGHSV
ncbi:MAG: bifunctional hydroxymethylpyrimidine kinase/phosphomethylpyrimidine kinase [Verrucomicrobiae bacterium]|nr:bifunctional hydroxymethylpyrimidine kinase/phosphomethylpyrimidine kinase [Verrucomicrobiae bacterium]